jgi:protein-tyrosine phosphatase
MKLEYYDIHTHILPQVDDGSSSIEETKEMLNVAVHEGVQTIIATPHYQCGIDQDNNRIKEIVALVQAEAYKINPNLKILLGNELYYSDSIVEDLKNKKALTLAGTRYILVEFSVYQSYDAIYMGLSNLIQAGYAPILAHVERYESLFKKEERIGELIKLGVYIQMNCSSLLGGIFHRENKYYKKLVKKGFVHFLSSDCHDSKYRTPLMYSMLQKQFQDGELANILFENPRMLLDNKFI